MNNKLMRLMELRQECIFMNPSCSNLTITSCSSCGLYNRLDVGATSYGDHLFHTWTLGLHSDNHCCGRCGPTVSLISSFSVLSVKMPLASDTSSCAGELSNSCSNSSADRRRRLPILAGSTWPNPTGTVTNFPAKFLSAIYVSNSASR